MSDRKANNAIKSFNIKYVSIYNKKGKSIDDSRKQAKQERNNLSKFAFRLLATS